ncbi:hypothetical protein QE152_g13298 [Popillia japonica]|uniref:Uncharacterized protein n=1 Tax=Popillia japonica TaxID=7064 RepID=A0AAW1LA54_POPJA
MEYRFPKDDLIALGISMLKLVGEFIPYNSQLPINIYRIFNWAMMILNTILLLANLPKADSYVYVQIIGFAVLFAHGLLRYICFVYYKSEIYGLLNDMEQFWNINQIKNIHKIAKKEYVFFMKAPTILIALGVVCIISFSFKPLAAKDGLIFPARVVVEFVGFQATLLFSQYYGLLIVATVVAGYDIIYICYSAHVITQIRMLKYKFEHITADISIETIYNYIRHHQFMLK